MGALDGVTIVDLSRILAGPFATQLLADLGATVIKVEPPGGDPTRAWGPPFERGDQGESAYFRCANRGKTSERVDLRDPAGRARVEALLADATVLVENFLPAARAELGLDPAAVRARHPHLIVASVRAFPADTAAADRPGYDFLLQAESGWMSITGEADGPPMKVGVALVDVLAGLYLANAIQAAVRERERTGVARHVEVSLIEAALAGLVNVGAGVLMTGAPAARYGNGHPNIVPYQSFAARDGDVAVAVGNDRQFADLMAALELGDALATNPEWRTNPGRVRDRTAVVAALAARIGAWTREEVLDRCARAGVAAGPVRAVDEVLLGQEGRLHRAIRRLRDPETGAEVAVVGAPIQFDGTRVGSPIPPPRA